MLLSHLLCVQFRHLHASRLPMADHASHASSSFFLAAFLTRARLR